MWCRPFERRGAFAGAYESEYTRVAKDGLTYGEIRDRESGQLQILTFASLLWHLFRALIEGALEGLVRHLGRKVVRKVLAAIDQTVEASLNDALQLSPQHVSAQLKAEELGYL